MKEFPEYPFEIRKLTPEEGGGYLVTFPDLPGCMSDGETVEEAVRRASDAEKSYILTAKELGGPQPPEKPGSASGKFMLRLPKSLHARLIARAKHEGVSMNTMSIMLLTESLTTRENTAKTNTQKTKQPAAQPSQA